jgi:hypothetical protein
LLPSDPEEIIKLFFVFLRNLTPPPDLEDMVKIFYISEELTASSFRLRRKGKNYLHFGNSLIPPPDPEEMVNIIYVSEELASSSSGPEGGVKVVCVLEELPASFRPKC